MRKTWLAVMAIGFAMPASACGPYFPENLLDDRTATLVGLPQRGFAYEAARLVETSAHFKANERADWIYNQPVAQYTIEREWLGDDYERADAVRREQDAVAAYARSEGMPEDARRYLAGAAAYAHDNAGEALRRFASVIELPADQRKHYGPWALFMQGRLLKDDDPKRAMQAFAQVRAAVAAGADDPLGLALDSYGEQARLLLDAGDTTGAIRLYAEQAAQGSRFGAASLLQVAAKIARDDAALDAAMRDPLSRQLLAAYLSTRGDVDDGASSPLPEGVADRVLDALDRQGVMQTEGAGRLAAFAYRSGRYELAGRFAAKSNDGLAAWVRAKLALRAGDVNAATAAYAEAAKAFPLDQTAMGEEKPGAREPGADYCRVRGESGTLALARGEYVAAMEHFFHANDWPDAAFVAESVLTLDELQAFVAKNAAQSVVPVNNGVLPDRNASLRALLARRLLRAERWDEALGFFDDPQLREKAKAYVDVRRGIEQGDRIEQAQSWYRASVLAREDGMDLIGYEFGPDMAGWGGSFEEVYSFGYAGATLRNAPPDRSTPAPKLPIAVGPIEGERSRVDANRARPDKRYHYRYVAADFAARAADLVPQRSQAYVALLCAATGYVLNDDTNVARGYWRRYVAHGPYVPWAENFGTQCEAPDFPAAAKRLRAERIAAIKRVVRGSLPYDAIVALMLAAAAALYWRRRRTVVAKPSST